MNRSTLVSRLRRVRSLTFRQILSAFIYGWIETQAGLAAMIGLSILGWASNIVLSWEVVFPILFAAFLASGWMNHRAHKREAEAIQHSADEIMRGLQPHFIEAARTELRAVLQAREEEINEQAAAGAARSYAEVIAYALSMTAEERARSERERRAGWQRTFEILDEAHDGLLTRLLEERKQREQAESVAPATAQQVEWHADDAAHRPPDRPAEQRDDDVERAR